MGHTVTSTEAKNQLNRLLAEVERTGTSVTITNHGRPVPKLVPVQPTPRMFGQLPNLVVRRFRRAIARGGTRELGWLRGFMNALLDTHALLWLVSAPDQIDAPALATLSNPDTHVWVSAASVREIALKTRIG